MEKKEKKTGKCESEETGRLNFSLEVEGTKGLCPAGENYANQKLKEGKIPVFSCEGACIRGEIARLTANMVAKEELYARCCHAETFTVPDSAMARWAKEADRVVMIDGCFLKCHDRVLKNLIDEEKIIHFDILPLYRKYTDLFDIDSVPEDERKEVARQVADKVLTALKEAA
jgi:uncharacterized metal-binding protein